MTEYHQRLVRAVIGHLGPLPEREIDELLAALTIVRLLPGEAFAQAGSESDRVGIVLRGLFRVYYLTPEGRECVCNFHAEGKFIGPYSAMLRRKPSRTTTEALELSEVAVFRYGDLQRLFDRHPGWERIGRRVAEAIYVDMVEREESLMTLSAEQRLAEFLSGAPNLIERVSKANIASYINVQPETLSRLLARRRLRAETGRSIRA